MARMSQVLNKEQLLKGKRRQRYINRFLKVLRVIEIIAICYLLSKAI